MKLMTSEARLQSQVSEGFVAPGLHHSVRVAGRPSVIMLTQITRLPN